MYRDKIETNPMQKDQKSIFAKFVLQKVWQNQFLEASLGITMAMNYIIASFLHTNQCKEWTEDGKKSQVQIIYLSRPLITCGPF